MKEAKKKLEETIRKLDRELRDELPKALTKALEMGDLRENAEYQAAKERQSYVQAQLAQLRARLAKLSLVDLTKIPTDKASYGSTVVILNLDSGVEETYRLVSSEEADVVNGMISTTSPIGRGLMGGREGDAIEIRTPRGTKHCEIVKVRTIHDAES